jgi:alkanesulfonate monooxygenase SsuD/methylene tetrahydromethanopterin reductase-like flavin-dependent oxidoreductase (luciferase family)
MTDGLVDNLAVSGTPEQIRRRLDNIRSEGIDELMVSQVVVHDGPSELTSLYEILT